MNNSTTPFVNCWAPTWENHPNPNGAVAAFNRWRTFRMDINPDTMEMKFFIYNVKYASYTPPDAATLKNEHFDISIGQFNQANVSSEGYINYIKLWP